MVPPQDPHSKLNVLHHGLDCSTELNLPVAQSSQRENPIEKVKNPLATRSDIPDVSIGHPLGG